MIFRKHLYATLSWILLWGISNNVAKADDSTLKRDHSGSWCKASQSEDNGPNDWKNLSEHLIHIVRASMQEQAKSALANNSFVGMTQKDIIPYLRDGESVSESSHIYLARAGAFYGNDKYEFPKPAFRSHPFSVSYSPSRDTLLISNFALGSPGIPPTNLAVAIEAPNTIARSEAVCLRTQ